jgi:hypothetical protein
LRPSPNAIDDALRHEAWSLANGCDCGTGARFAGIG